jgi:hypothetical protein
MNRGCASQIQRGSRLTLGSATWEQRGSSADPELGKRRDYRYDGCGLLVRQRLHGRHPVGRTVRWGILSLAGSHSGYGSGSFTSLPPPDLLA